MEEIKSSSSRKTGKRILLITLFVVPFLIGMALIFMGKGIGTLPFLFPEGKEGRKSVYYTLPQIELKERNGVHHQLSPQDSVIRLFCLFHKESKSEWGKHLMYVSKIVARYQNMEVWTIYEGPYLKVDWEEDPSAFIAEHKIWKAAFISTDEFEALKTALKAEVDSNTQIYPYVIVDKEHHIRAFCPINDLKQARDVPKMMKILNNQYAPRNAKLEKKS